MQQGRQHGLLAEAYVCFSQCAELGVCWREHIYACHEDVFELQSLSGQQMPLV